ncbi:MAG: Molybdopterin-synthase adenylyltransferase [Firmicutes bacterium]|nr:Molybdopterin-synthase adenylyltransferase [Bacillota bacterium]MDI6706602.1 ThiF family adenylyltransferase [Bacillota bacterium]
MSLERYSRQMLFYDIGQHGQTLIGKAKVAIIGVGALGTVIANNLARAGVGYIRLVDRDYVELSNLQRQTLFDEQDFNERLPKSAAAARHLKRVNSEIHVDPVVTDVNPSNVESLISDVDLVMDGTDNFETRFLINDACVKNSIPWIYGAALGSCGTTMNIIPGQTPCIRCFIRDIPSPGKVQTCSSAGVLNMITGIVGCYESVEALKFITGSPDLNTKMLYIDIWKNSFEAIKLERDTGCPVCSGNTYEFLDSQVRSYTTKLCGSNSVQIVPHKTGRINFEEIADRMKKLGKVEYNSFLLKFYAGSFELTLFPDGRAIIKNVDDENVAKSIYSEYLGI